MVMTIPNIDLPLVKRYRTPYLSSVKEIQHIDGKGEREGLGHFMKGYQESFNEQLKLLQRTCSPAGSKSGTVYHCVHFLNHLLTPKMKNDL